MERGNIEWLGPRRFGLRPVVSLPPELTSELMLLVPKEAFNDPGIDAETILAYQETVAARLAETAVPLWDDQDTQFLVVCGETLYASSAPFANFDQVAFDGYMPYLSTVIAHPAAQLPYAPLYLVPAIATVAM
jgi:hypothetical protein